MALFWSEKRGYLADVLLAEGYGPARQAVADTALRSNQLAAINVGLAPLEKARQAENKTLDMGGGTLK